MKDITYLDETDERITDDLLKRKEFQLFQATEKKTEFIPRFLIQNAIEKGNYLEMHSYQLFVKNYLNPNTEYSRLLIKWSTGLGKCLGYDTPVLMHNGMIKKVQDIKEGEYLMGDDSTPRKVLSLARGVDKMYDIIPAHGVKHTVNQEHILCLKYHENIVEMSVKDYLKLDDEIKSQLRLYKVAVEFHEIELPIDPYEFGLSIGTKHFYGNHLDTFTIPYIYKCNSRKNRLRLLAGIIESGALSINSRFMSGFYYLPHRWGFIDDIIFICNSLGFLCFKEDIYRDCGKYYQHSVLHIGGSSIENIIKNNHRFFPDNPTVEDILNDNILINEDLLTSEFRVEYVKEDNYYGFTIDGNRRFLLGDFTVTHNTVGALSIALNFINYYQKQEEYLSGDMSIGSVFVLGFTQQIFRDELFKYPEFGFISRDELEKLNKIKKQAYMGNIADIEHLKKFNAMLKKRLHSRKGNGFFTFIGYKELTNHLFIGKKEDNINLQSLEDDELLAMIESGKLTVNRDLLDKFANSLLICDEVHNIYNSAEKNNWGVAIQTILNYHKSCRALFLSATPLNNSPTESIDLLNLLLPRQHYSVLKKEDFFDKNENLLPEKENELYKYFRGRVSYIRNRNPKYMAAKIFEGEIIKGIDYLRFVRCPMSKFHYKTYQEALKDKETVGQDGQYLLDFAIPDPKFNKPFEHTGLYKSKDIRENLNNATQTWKNAVGILYNPKKDIIFGSALRGDNLEKISTKYKKMIDLVLQNIKQKNGKMFIYHNNIHVSGTLFIQEILYQNGIIGEFDNSSDNTICNVCGDIRKNHKKNQLISLVKMHGDEHGDKHKTHDDSDIDNSDLSVTHIYQPARFVIVHSNLDKKHITQSLEKFNHVNNIDGSKYMILIGSKIIKESHSMNSVRHIFIMSRPDNISTLVQIIGRAVRLNSHKLLPYKDRNVKILIFTSSIPNFKDMSYEEKKYRDKINVYKVIQKLEKIMHETAIDVYFNYDTIWRVSDEDKEFGLSILPYKKPNANHSEFKLNELNLSTFNAYHAKFEVEYIMYMIKKLFIEYSNTWKYEDLFNALKTPPFSVEINTKLISQDLFNIALNNLIYAESINYNEPKLQKLNDTITQSNLLDKVRNPDDKIFIENSIQYILTQYGDLYVMAPLINNEIPIGPEVLHRQMYDVKPHLINITDYLKHDMNSNYGDKKLKFIKKWQTVSINHLEMAVCDFGVRFHQEFIEEIIEYIFNVWTNPNTRKSEYHDFYVKMLYYYDLQKLIAWAHTINDTLRKKYNPYTLPVSTKLLNPKLAKELDIKNKESSGFINLLTSSINRDDPYWISTGMIQEYENKLKITNALFNGIYKKSKTTKKINADLLPVGHFLTRIPRFYIPNEGWRDDPTYTLADKSIKENPIIIGYDSRSKTGLSIKFKLRSPTQNIKQYKDSRMIEKGAICSTKSKGFLKDIAKKLKIDLDNSNTNIDYLCQQIRSKLIYNELKSRMSNKPMRWFYFSYETNEV